MGAWPPKMHDPACSRLVQITNSLATLKADVCLTAVATHPRHPLLLRHHLRLHTNSNIFTGQHYRDCPLFGNTAL